VVAEPPRPLSWTVSCWREKAPDDFVVLGDRDGNLFCVVQKAEHEVAG
jgi:hypothetical protein